MQIEVSFSTFKALTALREDENDSVDDVIIRLLHRPMEASKPPANILQMLADGLFIGGVLFPNGTQFRARYKGRQFAASIIDGVWTDADGTPRNSPSEAASAISNTNVNGWRFWEARFPNSNEWILLDRLRGK